MARQVKAPALSLITGTHVVEFRTHSDFHIHYSMDTHKLHKHTYICVYVYTYTYMVFLKLVM